MDGPNNPYTESPTASPERSDRPPLTGSSPAAPVTTSSSGRANPQSSSGSGTIRVGRRRASLDGAEIEVFTMTLGGETIELLPHRNWTQIDIYKWRARGKIPGTPAGLEIAPDHVKLAGDTVSPKEPDGTAKLERLFEAWLAVERQGADLARRRAQARPAPTSQTAEAQHFEVELDKEHQVHIHCVQGKEKLASIGLNPAGFQSLISQGLLRKPHALKTGALHDWVELDGVRFSFEKGNDDAARLAQALNETYRPLSAAGQGREVVVFANAASSTGFDIQFPAKVGGVPQNRRRPLDEAAIDLLQDPQHCGLLQDGLLIKLTRPTLIFKQKTPDGGERYLQQGPATLVRVCGEEGEEKSIDLSQPVNYLRLSAVELTAVFNHPAINRHARKDSAPTVAAPLSTTTASQERPAQPAPPVAPKPPSAPAFPVPPAPAPAPAPPKSPECQPLPNLWLKPILTAQPIRHDWFTCLVYSKIAARVGNSREGQVAGLRSWLIALEPSAHPDEHDRKAIFLDDHSGFGFLCDGHMVRFLNGALLLGNAEASVKAESVRLVAAGVDSAGKHVFIVSDEWRSRFGNGEAQVEAELSRLNQNGAALMSVKEVLESPVPLVTVWTVPAEQANPADPSALEHTCPA